MKKITRYIFALCFSLFVLFYVGTYNVKADDNTEKDDFKMVINPDSNGEPTYSYPYDIEMEVLPGVTETVTLHKQYTNSRDIVVSIYIAKDTTSVYSNKFQVCEIIKENTEGNVEALRYCSEYMVSSDVVTLTNSEGVEEEWYVTNSLFQIRGVNDGAKDIEVKINRTDALGTTILTKTQEIIIDTTGPVITLEGGEYVYLAAGDTYTDLGAVCVDDSEVIESACKVTAEDKVIDSSKEGYQYIMYTAVDFLGNETNISRKIIVETKVEEGGISLYWIFAGIVVLLVGVFLIYVVLKNKEKQRNQSVL